MIQKTGQRYRGGRGQIIRHFILRGGLDITTPALEVLPGTLRGCTNFYPGLTGGYRRTGGYESLDGQPAPHLAIYYVLEVGDTSGFTVGLTTGVGGTSGASGIVISIDASKNWLIITKLDSGPFIATETLGGTTVTVPEIDRGADTAAEEQDFLLLAENEYRVDIAAVPGSGVIRGIHRINDRRYAFRDNAGATALDIYKATPSGWVQVTLASHTLKYTGGGGGTGQVIAVGDTVDGVTSGASGTVHRLILQSGSFSGNDATGYMVLTGVTGGPFSDTEDINISAVKAADADGASVAVAFAVGGFFQFINRNFFAGATTYRMYGCDGVNTAFEMDENDVVSPILLPDFAGAPASDAPFLLRSHKNHLFMSFENGSLQHSVLGEPLTVNGFLGSSEFGLGNEITDIQSTAGGVLVVWTTRETYGLYGTSIADWELRVISESTGCLPFCAASLGYTFAWDDKGITRLDRVQAFGDFETGTVSRQIQPLLNTSKSQVSQASVIRGRNLILYPLSTGEVVVVYVPETGKPEYGLLSLPVVINCIYNIEDENGIEHVYFGGSDGFVYEFIDEGTSFNGAEIEYAFRTNYNHFKSPQIRKSFKHLGVELDGDGEVSFEIATELSYSATHTVSNPDISAIAIGGAGFWGDAVWNDFSWSSQDIPTANLSITGTGVNLGVILHGSSAKIKPFTIQSFLVQYITRRIHRG